MQLKPVTTLIGIYEENAMLKQVFTRRDFLKTAWVAAGGIVALELGGLSLAYMQPRLAQGEFGNLITVGKVEDYPQVRSRMSRRGVFISLACRMAASWRSTSAAPT